MKRAPVVPFPLLHIRPGDDFYKHVNGRWLRAVKTPPFLSYYGVSEEIEEIIRNQQITLIKDCIHTFQKNPDDKLLCNKIARFGLSSLRPSVQNESIDLLKKMLKNIHCMRDISEVGSTLGEFARYRISSVISIYSYFKSGKDTTQHFSIGIGELGLPDNEYYVVHSKENTSTLISYGKLLDTLAKMLSEDPLSGIIPFESHLANTLESLRSDDEVFIKGDELHKKFPIFPWETFWLQFGLPEWKTYTFRIDCLTWIKGLEHYLKNVELDDWKRLLSAHLILHALPLLPPPYDDIHSAFYDRRLRGQTQKLPQIVLTVKYLQEWMTTTLSCLYLKTHIDQSIKKEAKIFTKKIQDAAVHRLREIDWMDPTTKKEAIQKIQRMYVGVGFPDTMPSPSNVDLTVNNLFQNILLLGEERTHDDIKSLGKKKNINSEWDDPIFAVNAYYYSETNQMIIPAGSLLWPFYSKVSPYGWNFGGLGAVIGHEMTHAFDSDGKDYNEYGEKVNWWKESDLSAYEKKTHAIISLFNKAKVLDHAVNGNKTLNENIADLGGLAIALAALETDMTESNLSEIKKKEAYRNFFNSFAVSWRIKEKPEKILQGLFMDRHAPAPLRVNLIVNQFDQWYSAFDIRETDALYIAPEKRIRIF